MKKLMIAAATAAMIGGAFAAACDEAEIRITPNGVCDDAEIGGYIAEDCRVWDFAITLKTLAPKKMTCKGDCTTCGEKTTITYLDTATRKFTGYAWTCTDECFDSSDEIYVTLWEKATKSPIVPMWYNWVDPVKRIATQDPDTFVDLSLFRYGKKATKVAAYWELEGDDDLCPFVLAGAGLNGSGQKKLFFTDDILDEEPADNCYGLLLKSISGYAVGAWPVSPAYKESCFGIYVYPIMKVGMCDCFSTWCDADDEFDDGDKIPAYGSWSLKYNKKLSTKGASMLTLVPSYALVER